MPQLYLKKFRKQGWEHVEIFFSLHVQRSTLNFAHMSNEKSLNAIPNSSLREGIKAVGVGKKGSKPLTAEQVEAISLELKEESNTPAAVGAFLGGLFFKGLTEDETKLAQALPTETLSHPQKLVSYAAFNAPRDIKELCIHLLQKKELSKAQAHRLGLFLFSDEPGDGARGLCASVLRVRYETADEYAGLLAAAAETFNANFQQKFTSTKPIIQLAEPFDGVDNSFMITPLISKHLQNQGFHVVIAVGRNSGPKFDNNLYDIAQGLNADFLKSSKQINQSATWGWFLDQKDLSLALDHWVDIRHQIIKRPFLATIERFVNPLNADTLIASAFHPPYGDKMLTLGETAGFKNVIIIRNGMEGTIAFPLLRPAKILYSFLKPDGKRERHEIDVNAKDFCDETFDIEEKLINPSLAENIRLIQQWDKEKKTDNRLFDARVKVTLGGINKIIKEISSQ